MLKNLISRATWGIRKRIRLFFNSYEKVFSNKNSKIYFVGIGGIGMSAIAFLMNEEGFKISGSDIRPSPITDRLIKSGVKVNIGQEKENIESDTDVLVVSSAISKSNPEIIRAIELGIPIVKRSFILGKLMAMKRGVAISGTHGKTTTTTMLSIILKEAGLDPVAMIGGEVKNIGGNFLSGKGDLFVAEACEYDKSFLDLYPEIAIITNIEADHLDYYKGIGEIKEAFSRFIKHIPEKGLLVISADETNSLEVAKDAKCTVVGFGFGSRNRMQNDSLKEYWEIEEVKQEKGKVSFVLSDGNGFNEEFTLHIPGKHNIANACASIIVAKKLGVETDVIRKFLSDFKGTNRRFQIKGTRGGTTVIDDYSHHPTEIKYALEGAKRFFKDKKILAVFEPHQYSRTYLLKKEFGESFENADEVIIPGIYESRDSEEDKKKIKPQDLVDEINKKEKKARYISGYEGVVKYLRESDKKEERVIMTMGAGNVYKVGEVYLSEK